MDSIFIECFSDLQDPRVDRTKKHLLLDIIALAVCGVLSGTETWEELEDFGQAHQDWFSQFLHLPHGIPSHDTLSRVFSALDPQALQACSLTWLKRIQRLIPETVIAVDGKSLRGSKRTQACQQALHVINAWSCANGICLGQLKVDAKSNEIPAVPELLKLLYLKGAIVTLDAMGAQEATVAQIVDAQADYVIALKGNQGELHQTVKDSFQLLDSGHRVLSVYQAQDDIEPSHGKIEQRCIETLSTDLLKDQIESRWKNLHTIARITYQRTEQEKVVIEQRYYISSLSADHPAKILSTIRSHWQVENNLHWSLDVTFKEDQCRIREERAAQNFSWLRKLSLGLLKNETSFKASIRRKQRKACTDLSYLAQVVKQI